MSRSSTDRNLLFGFVALQNNFISREDLIAAVSAWLEDKSRPLDEILLQRQVLAQDEHALLAALVAKHLGRHGNDPEKSLAALSSVGSLRDELQRLGDPDIQASLALVSAASGQADPYATQPFVSAATAVTTRFCILRPHAKGGLGEVFVARDLELNREVALKEIHASHVLNQASRSRFVLEAEITGNLEHPGIVPVYGLGQYADGRPFYAMRFIRGDSLKEAVDRFHSARIPHSTFDTLAFRGLLGRFIDVCNAIEYAHSRGVLHRDLKPGNIMLGKYGETLVVDWGLAKPLVSRREHRPDITEEATLRPSFASGSAPTQMGSAVGTPPYMSPEQAAGRLDQLGPASDVYSLGATLYYVLTGAAPFAREDMGAILRKVQAGEFRRPREVNPHIPKPLEAICLKAMALRAEDRHVSPRALADDVERYLADEAVPCHRESLANRLRRWGRRHRAVVASAAVGAAVLLVALAGGLALAARHNAQLLVEQKKTEVANAELAKSNDLLRDSNEQERLARQEAQNRQAEAEVARADEAQARRRAEGITSYLVQAFRSPDPARDGRTIAMAEVLQRSVQDLEGKFEEDPQTKAALLSSIGEAYQGLGLYQETIPLFLQARDLMQARLGPENADTLRCTSNLAVAYVRAGNLEQALPLLDTTAPRRGPQAQARDARPRPRGYAAVDEQLSHGIPSIRSLRAGAAAL